MQSPQPLFGLPRTQLPFAPQGWPFIIPTAALWMIAVTFGWGFLAFILLVTLAFLLNFFRDPERDTPADERAFVSPADGKVVRAEVGSDGLLRVDVFMNVFNVHVNRAPMAGQITSIRYFPGKFLNASFDKASEENERCRFEMTTPAGDTIAFTQIAGLIARRIVSYTVSSDVVTVGQRVGMIRFGSRVNCEMPGSFSIQVKVGDIVQAGETILAVRTR